jgi:hypothetical protein
MRKIMIGEQNIEQLGKEEQLSKDARKLLKEIESSVRNEDPMLRGIRMWSLLNKDNIYS